MEIQQLRGFHAVAKYKNFTVAARNTQRTQPTISLQVKALEEELGVKLFERLGSKKVTLTREGELLRELTAPLLQEFSTIVPRFNEARGNYSTTNVKIATHSSVMTHLLPLIIKRFRASFPECRLTLYNRSQPEIVSMLDAGEADFAITSMATVPPQFEYKVFSRFSRILIANKDHPLAGKAGIGLEDIARYPLILPTPDSNTRKLIDRSFAERGLSYVLAMEVVGRTAIKTYVGMNLGISIINEYYVSEDDKRRLFVKNMSRYFGKAETGLLMCRGKALSIPAQEFVDLLVK